MAYHSNLPLPVQERRSFADPSLVPSSLLLAATLCVFAADPLTRSGSCRHERKHVVTAVTHKQPCFHFLTGLGWFAFWLFYRFAVFLASPQLTVSGSSQNGCCPVGRTRWSLCLHGGTRNSHSQPSVNCAVFTYTKAIAVCLGQV